MSRADWESHLVELARKRAQESFSNVEIVDATTLGKAVTRARPLASVPAGEPYANLLVMFAERGIYPPVKEYLFAAPDRRFRFDYAWPTAGKKVALEIDGGVWRKGGGAHSHPSNIMRDIEKHNLATMLGWRVIRATPDKLADAVAQIEMLLTGEVA